MYANPNVVQNPFPNPPNQALAAQPQPYQLAFPTLPSLNQPITVKLDQNNFVLWKNRLLNIIIENGLEEYIDGSYPCPPKLIDPQNRVQNPEYTTWRRFNRIIMSWIYASLTEEVMGQIVEYTTALEIWNALEQIYSSASMARIIELRNQLQFLKKGRMTAMEYIQKLKSLCNTLAAIGVPVSRNDNLIYMFNGLDKYNPFVSSIQNQPDFPSIQEVHSLFLSYESCLERKHTVTQVNPLQANVNSLHQNKKYQKPPNPTFNYQNNSQTFPP
ncbi:hypothetical protein TIFTF001_053389 [Ficus carica]|uniref:Uncharacterized protein n=1 Tax=Ficus carica TaxID=3494 RepID=A0AA88EBP6_FICCA|nr:hypothetical protein TIFTF001_053389 [Ficus carica]